MIVVARIGVAFLGLSALFRGAMKPGLAGLRAFYFLCR